jgi:hypothetical protein
MMKSLGLKTDMGKNIAILAFYDLPIQAISITILWGRHISVDDPSPNISVSIRVKPATIGFRA